MSQLKQIKVNGQQFDIRDGKEEGTFSMPEERSHEVILLEEDHHIVQWQSIDADYKMLEVKIDGVTYVVKLETTLDLQIEKLGYGAKKLASQLTIYAPMPGQVLDIKVSDGQTVDEGMELLTLEAMKMENVVLNKQAGRVKAIHVSVQQNVSKGQLLIEIE